MSSSTIYNQSRPCGVRPNRNGFTLTELLIAITIIGLLVGLLATAGAGVIKRSQEFAVSAEVIQMSQSVENFKTKFGFFPPSFEQFKRQSNSSALALVPAEANQLLPFLNKIAPNHRERELSPSGSGLRRIDEWWLGVGMNLNQQTSLQFWLSGLCQNKQFPLTGGLAGIPKGFNINEFIDGTEIVGGLERDVLFDFDEDRLIPVPDIAGTANLPVAQYNMNHGKTNGDLFYLYRDSESYLPYVQPDVVASGNTGTGGPGFAPDFTYTGGSTPSLSDLEAYLAFDWTATTIGHSGAAYYAKQFSPDGTELRLRFGNPNSFQLISAGIDGEAGVSAASVDRGDVELQLPSSADNLCNFADGRLDKFINEIDGLF